MAGEDLQKSLEYLTREVGQISVAIVQIAKQEQKIVHLLQRQDRTEREVETLQVIVTGPDGVLVRAERTATKLAGVCVISSAFSAALVSSAVTFFMG